MSDTLGFYRYSSTGALRQYYQPAEPLDERIFVQAAQIITLPNPAAEAVRVRDLSGLCSAFAHPGLFANGIPVVDDWLLLWPDGRLTWLAQATFASDWAEVCGPELS